MVICYKYKEWGRRKSSNILRSKLGLESDLKIERVQVPLTLRFIL